MLLRMWHPACAVAALGFILIAGCSSVTIDSQRSPELRGPMEPVTFVIFQKNTGREYTEPLAEYMRRELKRRNVLGKVEIVTGVELNEEELVAKWMASSHGTVFISPTGGTSYYGSLSQILYDVRAFENVGGDQVRVVWRGRVDTSSGAYGFQIDGRLERLAEDLVSRLVDEGVLPRR